MRTVKMILKTETTEKMRRGRPRKGWNAEIETNLRKRGLNWDQAKQTANDRVKQKKVIDP